MDVNTMTEADLGVLPDLTPAIAKALVAKRPFLSITDLNAFLLAQGLTAEQATGGLPEGVRAHQPEHRHARGDHAGAGRRPPRWCANSRNTVRGRHGRSSTGRSASTSARSGAANAQKLAQYTFIPMNANTATDADLMTVPGANQAWVDEVQEGRPYKTAADLAKASGPAHARFFVVE